MLQIRPVSDLRNKFSEIEQLVTDTKSPVILTKNGYGSMVILSLQMYDALTSSVEAKLDEADTQAQETEQRLSHEAVFAAARNHIQKK